MTTKQEMQEQAKKLQEELDKLHQQIDSIPDEVETKRWRSICENYWTIDSRGQILCDNDYGTDTDNKRYALGNYFKTEQEAKEYKENLLTKQRLKDLALRLNNGVKICWIDDDQAKYHIAYSKINDELRIGVCNTYKYNGVIYCLDSFFLDKAKKEIGEDKLIKLIKSGV